VSDVDALLPPAIAARAEEIGVQKANSPAFALFALAVLAGAFIALGAAFSTVVATAPGVPFGVHRLLIGLSFCLGLVLVIVGGAELFTGNNLIAMAWASRRIGTRALLRNWGIVLAGNAAGAIGTVLLVDAAGLHSLAGEAVGQTAVRIAAAKCALSPLEAYSRGILCNALVCLAVWQSYGARSTVDRIAVVIFPVTAFVAMGLEHSIANLYFLPAGILAAEDLTPAALAQALSALPTDALPTWGRALANLIPVTLGNIVGGTVLVAAVYWAVYRRGVKDEPSE